MTTARDVSRVEEIRDRANACLEGPWEQISRNGERHIVMVAIVEDEAIDGDVPGISENGEQEACVHIATVHNAHADDALIASFMANAREDIPYLLALLADREAELAKSEHANTVLALHASMLEKALAALSPGSGKEGRERFGREAAGD